MPLLFVTLDTQAKRGSSAASNNTAERVLNKASDAEGSTPLWPLFWPTRKLKSSDEPLSPFSVGCVSMQKTGKGRTVRPAHGREVLRNVRKLLSRIVCLTSSHAHPVEQLQVFAEVRRETFYDSERDAVSPQKPLEWDDATNSRSNSYRHRQVRLPTRS